jgi:hypothetical protein
MAILRLQGGNFQLFATAHRVLDTRLFGNILDYQAELAFRPSRAADKCFFYEFSPKAAKNS